MRRSGITGSCGALSTAGAPFLHSCPSIRFRFLYIILVLVFFILAILVGMKWYLVMVSICISFLANKVQPLHVLIGHLSLEKCLLRSFAHFLIVFLLMS